MFKFFHHLFNPHCPDCSLEKECRTCDTLRSLLESERFEKKELLKQLLDLTKPIVEVTHESNIPQPLKPHFTPWRVKQAELEEADRVKARIMHDREKQVGPVVSEKKSVEELEKQLDIEEKENAS